MVVISPQPSSRITYYDTTSESSTKTSLHSNDTEITIKLPKEHLCVVVEQQVRIYIMNVQPIHQQCVLRYDVNKGVQLTWKYLV